MRNGVNFRERKNHGKMYIEMKQSLFSSFVSIVMVLYLTVKAFDGPIRFVLVNADKVWVVYIPTFLLLLPVLIKALQVIYTLRLSSIMLGIIITFFATGVLGILCIGNIVQVLFGFYVLVPFVFGVSMASEIIPQIQKLLWFFTLLWIVSVFGVLLDYFIDFPWAGLEYEISGIRIEGVRRWWAFGFERLAGFARASFDAATIISILSLFLIIYRKKLWIKIAVWVISYAAIILTTSKGIIAAYLVVTSLLLMWFLMPNFVLRAIPYLIIIVVISIPIYSWTHNIYLDINKDIERFLLTSFEDRLTNIWPDAYELVYQNGIYPFGRGIGGIGVPQDRFEWTLFNPGDNLFVYLFGIAGFFAVLIVLFIARQVSKFGVDLRSERNLLLYLLGVEMLLYGIVVNVVENSYMSMFLGVLVRSASHLKQRRMYGLKY